MSDNELNVVADDIQDTLGSMIRKMNSLPDSLRKRALQKIYIQVGKKARKPFDEMSDVELSNLENWLSTQLNNWRNRFKITPDAYSELGSALGSGLRKKRHPYLKKGSQKAKQHMKWVASHRRQ